MQNHKSKKDFKFNFVLISQNTKSWKASKNPFGYLIYIVHIEKESKESLSIFHKKLLEILPKQETHLFPVN